MPAKEYCERAPKGICKICGNKFRTVEDRGICGKCNANEMGSLTSSLPPLPKPIEHKQPIPIKDIGVKGPYCKGTTGFSTRHNIVACYSCDATWSLQRQYIGVMPNIGMI
jgi:hypothetical protein